jgi:hypothetical protein
MVALRVFLKANVHFFSVNVLKQGTLKDIFICIIYCDGMHVFFV